MLRTRVAVLFARTSVSQVENAGDAALLISGLATDACSCLNILGGTLWRGGDSKFGLFACGGVLGVCEFAT